MKIIKITIIIIIIIIIIINIIIIENNEDHNNIIYQYKYFITLDSSTDRFMEFPF